MGDAASAGGSACTACSVRRVVGSTPGEAFFGKCDRTTMTQDDIENGRLIALVGIAPVKAGGVRDLPNRPVEEAALRQAARRLASCYSEPSARLTST